VDECQNVQQIKALCAKISETTTSSFITVEGEEEMDVNSHGRQ